MGHRLGQFIDPTAEVRAVLPKLLERRDHPCGLLLTQDRQLQIKEFPALGMAIISSLRREDQDDQIGTIIFARKITTTHFLGR